MRKSILYVAIILSILLSLVANVTALAWNNPYLGSFTVPACGANFIVTNNTSYHPTDVELRSDLGVLTLYNVEEFPGKVSSIELPEEWIGLTVEVWAIPHDGSFSLSWEDISIECPAIYNVDATIGCSEGTVALTTNVPGTFEWTISLDGQILDSGEEHVTADMTKSVEWNLEDYGPYKPYASGKFTPDDEVLEADEDSDQDDHLTCGEPPAEDGFCYLGDETRSYWLNGELHVVLDAKVSGPWRVINLSNGEVVAEGERKHVLVDLVQQGRTPNRYAVEVLINGSYKRFSNCTTRPCISLVGCGPHVQETIPGQEMGARNLSTLSAEETKQLGFQIVFYTNGPCLIDEDCVTIEADTRALIRGFQDFSVLYKNVWHEAGSSETLAGTIYTVELQLTWLQDGQDFSLWGTDHETRLRDLGPVQKYNACSLSVGLYDIRTDGTAMNSSVQTSWDWASFLIQEMKVLPNTESGWQQASEWAHQLMISETKTLSLQSIATFGQNQIDLSAFGISN